MANQSAFRTSINIKYDIGNEEFLKNYLPTPSHAESIIGISEGFMGKSASSAHILVGPYGSGKSLLATILASVISKQVSTKAIDTLVDGFNNVHQDVYESLLKLKNVERKYIPVILNGSYEDFTEALLRKIEQELLKHNVNITLPTEQNNIISTIEKWKKDFPTTYENFIQKLIHDEKRATTLEQWLSMIESSNRNEISWFKNIYTYLTSGAEFNSFTTNNLTDNLKVILDYLSEKNLGLFIIHDEFGRLLQGIEQSKIYKTMQELQDVAEFVNRSNGRIQLLLISHRSMSRYMVGFFEEYQSEFERIEKRFSSYYVESDSATYYRIVERYLTNMELNNNPLDANERQTLAVQIKSFNLFEELNQHEVDNLIVKGCYPIHPVTLFMLPRISKIFGQNERTLFTYLTSSEPFAFHSEIKKESNHLIYADSLFKYFFSEKTINNLYDENTKETLNLYLSIKANLDARKINAYRIVHFMTLWELTSANQIYQLDELLIAFATGLSRKQVDQLLHELMQLKLVRFNRIHNRYELSEGSSIVVENLIEEEKLNYHIEPLDRINVLYDIFGKRYYLATDYNDAKNITRFMRTKFINSNDLLNNINHPGDLIHQQSDGTVVYILLDRKSDYKRVQDFVSETQHPQLIFAIIKNSIDTVEFYIDNIIAIQSLKENKMILREYKNLDVELMLYIDNYEHEIDNFLNPLTNFTDAVDWYYCGKRIFVDSELDLEEKISKIMQALYPKTPIIMNDAVNRFNVIGIQKRSLLNLIDKVLYSSFKENIGIEGHGPEYLIYATIIKNLNINLNCLEEIGDKYVQEIRKSLLALIEENQEGSLYDMYNTLRGFPFGIRPPLIPVLIVILLKDKWNQLMFYRNGMYVPANEGEKIYEMFLASEDYEYVFQSFSTEKTLFLNQTEERFKKFISEHVANESQLIRVSSGMLNWLRKLPRQTQITTKFTNDRLNSLKSSIRKSEVNPIDALKEIVELYKGDLQEFEKDISSLEKSFDKFAEHVEKVVCSKLKIEKFSDKSNALEKIDSKDRIKNNLLSILDDSADIEEFAFNYIGTHLKEWSDINYDLFVNQLESDIDKLFSGYEVDGDTYELKVNDSYRQIKKVELSRKSQVIYGNMERMIKNAGRTVSKDEINYILLKLVNDYIE